MNIDKFIFITSIILTIIILIVFVIKELRKLDDIVDLIFSGIFSIFISFVISIFIVAIPTVIIIGLLGKVTSEKETYIPIVSLDRGSLVSGRFILGSGTIKEETYYFMYRKVRNNEYKLFNLPTKEYNILETNKKPGVYYKKERIELGFLWEETEEPLGYIAVPKGTIVREFKP